MSKSLKPCPFCGNSASISTPFVHAKCAWVKCNTCGAKTKKIKIYDMYDNEHITSLDRCKVKAITAWNTRVAEPEARALTIEELREMDGKPIWCVDIRSGCYTGWHIIILNKPYQCIERTQIVQPLESGSHYHRITDYSKTWLAYDKPPKGASESE